MRVPVLPGCSPASAVLGAGGFLYPKGWGDQGHLLSCHEASHGYAMRQAGCGRHYRRFQALPNLAVRAKGCVYMALARFGLLRVGAFGSRDTGRPPARRAAVTWNGA